MSGALFPLFPTIPEAGNSLSPLVVRGYVTIPTIPRLTPYTEREQHTMYKTCTAKHLFIITYLYVYGIVGIVYVSAY